MNTKQEITRLFYADASFWALTGSNLVVIVWALIEQWSLSPLMWIYWCQSVVIGIFWFFKILGLRQFSTKDLKINDHSVPPTKDTRNQTAVFFLMHYGFFHLVYFIFLVVDFRIDSIFEVITAAGIFVLYQGYSFFYNQKWLTKTKPNIGKMMLFPYARVIPMHLTILFAGAIMNVFSGSIWVQRPALVLFLLLKLTADAIMHVVEQKGFSD